MPLISPSHVSRPSLTARHLMLLAGLFLVACSGGGGSGDTTGGTTGATSGGDSGNSTSGGNTGGNAFVVGTTAISRNAVDPAGSSFYSDVGRQALVARGEPLAVMFEVVENHGGDAFAGASESCQTLGAEYASCSVSNLHIKDSNSQLNAGGWKLYFHNIRRILRVDSDEFEVAHVNGDLYVLEPSDTFDGFESGVETIALVTEFNYLIESDFMPRYWLVDAAGNVTLIPNTDNDTDESDYAVAISGDNRQAFNGEPLPIANTDSRFVANSAVTRAVADVTESDVRLRIIPSPVSVTPGAGNLDISGGFSFASLPLPAASIEALTARQRLFMSTGGATPLSGSIEASLPDNSYTLDIDASGITLAGADDEALFHAAQSLLSLVEPGQGSVPHVSITDSPRFGYRGMHLDIARNFHPRGSIEALIDQMAAYKLNRLHLHLADDEGWRLQIPSLPELTAVGSQRAFNVDGEGNVIESGALMPQLGSGPYSSNAGSGHLSRADFVALLAYARARHVVVIPEFDMPAHARAAVVAMRARAAALGDINDTSVRIDDPADSSRYLTVQHYRDGILNPCVPGTRNFIETVIADVQAMYAEANAELPIWHMGGDEARNVFRGGGFQDRSTSNPVPWRGFTNVADWDLPWERSPACAALISNNPALNSRDDIQSWFVSEVSDMVAAAGIGSLYAFQDIYGDNINAGSLATTSAGVNFWESISAGGAASIDALVNRGFDVVVAPPDFLYFDFPQEINPAERGYYWATRYTDTRKVFGFAPVNLAQNAEVWLNRDGLSWSASNTVSNPSYSGLQAHLWTETVRTREQLDYMLYPRLLALAERAWHRADWELDPVAGRSYSGSTNFVDAAAMNRSFAVFSQALVRKELPKLDAAGIGYRIPVPGASATSGMLQVNLSLPGLPLQVSTDGNQFIDWQNGMTADNVVAVRALSADRRRAGRADTLLP